MAVVRGRVQHGDVPVASQEVWLCRHYVARTLACEDGHLTTRSDANGVFAFARVPAGDYMALVVPSGSARGLGWGEEEIRSIRAGDVLDVPVAQQITDDLVLRSPTRGAAGVATRPEFRWDAVPGAAYYLVTVQSLSFRVRRPFPCLRQRYARANFTAEAPLDAATYTWFVESFDSRDRPLSRSAPGATFTVRPDRPDRVEAFTRSSLERTAHLGTRFVGATTRFVLADLERGAVTVDHP
jgi:hypothetical protein